MVFSPRLGRGIAAGVSPWPAWLAPRIAALHAGPHRTGSLIITLYGDAIVPRGGSLAVASLLAIMAGLGIGEGVVRTALSRLAAEGWLEARRRGRRSFYHLAAKGVQIFAEATRRIYDPPRLPQGCRLELVIAGPECPREAAREALLSAGFGSLAPGVFVAPAGTPVPPLGGLLRLQATPAAGEGAGIAALAWPLAAVAERYRHFMALWQGAAEIAAPDPLPALLGRILLIHDYRRAVLRDPLLPRALLPADWPQPAARALCGRLWRRLLGPSEAWLDAHAFAENGPLPAANAALAARFADLDPGLRG